MTELMWRNSSTFLHTAGDSVQYSVRLNEARIFSGQGAVSSDITEFTMHEMNHFDSAKLGDNHTFQKGSLRFRAGVKEIKNPLIGGRVTEIRQPLMEGGVIKNNLSVVDQNQHYITINKRIFAQMFGTLCRPSQINKLFILP